MASAVGEPPSRAQAGLPPHAFVFCCFNNTYKILPAVFDIWMRLLDKVPGSVLWLSPGNATAKANLRREAVARRKTRQHRSKLQVTIGDMNDERTARSNSRKVQRHRFARHQMHWNGIGAERVEHQ